MPFTTMHAQEKIVVDFKINFYKEHLSDNLNRVNIVFEPVVRFADFDDKTKMPKLKFYESSITAKKIISYMSFLGWRLIDSANNKNIGLTFY